MPPLRFVELVSHLCQESSSRFRTGILSVHDRGEQLDENKGLMTLKRAERPLQGPLFEPFHFEDHRAEMIDSERLAKFVNRRQFDAQGVMGSD